MSVKAWFEQRKRTINERVTAHDILRAQGVKLSYSGDREEQFSCPFHGRDTKPSARVFPGTPQSPSHAWCYVCRERWDVINLWAKYHGTEGFHRTLTDIERHYNIETPPVPEGPLEYDPGDAKKEQFEALHRVCEERLADAKPHFDLKGHLLIGSVLDKVLYQVASGSMSYSEAMETFQKVRLKIIEKVGLQCHDALDLRLLSMENSD